MQSFRLTVTTDGSLSAGIDVEAMEGLGDTGELSDDLTDVLVALGEAAMEHDTGVVFLLDEVQYLSATELEALIAALHKTVQRALPITLVGAGLPQLPRLGGEAKSYAERLFKFPQIRELSEEEAGRALIEPARERDVVYEDDAVAAIFSYTEGYPYFIQEYGNVLWGLVAAFAGFDR